MHPSKHKDVGQVSICNYVASSRMPVSAEEAFAYHDRPGALQRLLPPWESIKIEHSEDCLEVGSRVVLRTKVMGVPVRWVEEHSEYDPPRSFADQQVSGPFASWNHHHEFAGVGRESSLIDNIEYRLPLGAMGKLLGDWKVRGMLESMFAYRHRVTRDDLTLQDDHPTEPLRVAISGSSGMVGRQLAVMLGLLGHHVRPIVRQVDENDSSIAVWESEQEAAKLSEVDAVVHLAGKPIADSRWSDSIKKEIRDSRVVKTRQLCESLAKLSKKPAVLVCASATGVYGDRDDEMLDERSSLGNDFLAGVAKEWESACQPAIDAGIRVVHARLGIVLATHGGALQKMLTPAKFAAGSLGNGNQWWSWIALDDVLGGIYHAITDTSLQGPVNFVSPEPITNQQFAKTLANVLGRPALFPAPTCVLRVALGEMADALLLASTRAMPARLTESNYRFRFSELDDLLRYSLGITKLRSAE